MRLYTELAEWWPLLSSPEEYADSAAHHWAVVSRHARRPVKTLLELGCGGGNNASHLKRRCHMTLSDLSPNMLAVSRGLNPECEHVAGDMRSLRLERSFDAVFVHDAVMFLRTEEDLSAAMRTAFVHCAPGGVALFVPDCTTETWRPTTSHGGHDGADRSLRYLEWTWDPDPTDTEYIMAMTYVLREGAGAPRIESDLHRLGLFPRATWLRLMESVGFRATTESCDYAGGEACLSVVGLCDEGA